MKYHKHFDHWTVLYPSGYREYFKTEEHARYVCLHHGGIGLTPPLFRGE
jgi:hypothetical protein